MQLSTEPFMRGRVMALRLAIGVGTTPLGAPIVGWVADVFGPRCALGIGAASGFAAAGVALYYLVKCRRLGICPHARRPHSSFGTSELTTESQTPKL